MTVVVPDPESTPAATAPGREWPTAVAGRSGQGGELAIWTDQGANRCVLRLRGRLCADTVPLLNRHVDRLGCRWCDDVVVDVGSLVTMDAVGAGLLVGLSHYVAARGGTFSVQGASPEAEAELAAAEVALEG